MNPATIRRERVQRLSLDIDTRLVDVWRQLDELPELTVKLIAPLMRIAYASGYEAALVEPRGKLYRENGYRVPGRSGS